MSSAREPSATRISAPSSPRLNRPPLRQSRRKSANINMSRVASARMLPSTEGEPLDFGPFTPIQKDSEEFGSDSLRPGSSAGHAGVPTTRANPSTRRPA